MKSILCYGDSNTWGSDPAARGRFGPEVRWTGVLAKALGDGYRVIEEGLNGRTTVWDDPIEEERNGRAYLRPCLASHQPLDMVVIMLGTNDLKCRFGLCASDIAQAAGTLGAIAREAMAAEGREPVVLLVAPPPIGKLSEFDQMFAGAEATSRQFGRYYREAAARADCAFLDAGQVIVSSDLDGIHFEAGEHHKLGQAIAAEVRRLLG